MKILVITSELLDPAHILNSTFELSQAQVLSADHELAILSVNVNESLSSGSKALLKTLLRGQLKQARRAAGDFSDAFQYAVLGRKKVRHHQIEGVEVFEAIGYSFASPVSFDRQLAAWVRAGMHAFGAYCSKYGKPDIIHAHGRFLNAGALALAIKERFDIPYIYTEHSTYFQRGLAPSESRPVLNKVIDNSSCFIAVSGSLLEHVSRFLNRKFEKAQILPNVLDNIFEKNVPVKPATEPWIFTNIASLDHKKGIDTLIHAFAKAFKGRSTYLLNIAGEGPLKEELQQLAASLGITSSINFTGKLDKPQVQQLLSTSHVFVLPSRLETFGVVVIEAMAQGCPVVATISGGPEFIVDATSGLLVKPDDADALAEALQLVVQNYSSYNQQTIRQTALERYGANPFRAAMNRAYESTVA